LLANTQVGLLTEDGRILDELCQRLAETADVRPDIPSWQYEKQKFLTNLPTITIPLLSTDRAIEEISDHPGLEVNLQRVEDLREGRSLEDDSVSRVMLSAKDEVLVADMGMAYGEPSHAVPAELLQQHYRGMLDRARESASFTYHRIYQLDNPAHWPASFGDSFLLEHFRTMCELSRELDDRVLLRVTARIFPYTWIVVDRRTVILELYQYDNRWEDKDGAPTYTRGLIVTDSDGSLVGEYLDMWRRLNNHRLTRTPTVAELSNLDG